MIDITKHPKDGFWLVLADAEVGDRIIYHTGLHCGGLHKQDAMNAYARGLVLLMQSRAGPGMFNYIAQKIKPRKKK